jgi:exopolyphosphatase / guanosine-5'-triphosphate,3'-diphosphate pyrophosphatase
MKSTLAIIDLGTNTFHLMLAERQNDTYRITYREKQAVKLGLGGINQNRITEDAIERAVERIKQFKKTINAHHVEKTLAFGTSALRNAANRDEVLERIKTETGIDVTVISGDQEAEFIYHGICLAMDLGKSKSLIMDIGGGSVEFIIGNRDELFWKRSLEIGGQRLMELFLHHDPITKEEIKTLDTYFDTTLPELFDALQLHQPDVLVGSSGTFDTLSDIYCIRKGITKDDDDPETPLTFSGFHDIYQELITKNRKQRLAIPGMIELRVDMIVVACCLIQYVLAKHSFSSIRVSGYSLKEGALAWLNNTIS